MDAYLSAQELVLCFDEKHGSAPCSRQAYSKEAVKKRTAITDGGLVSCRRPPLGGDRYFRPVGIHLQLPLCASANSQSVMPGPFLL